MNVSISAPTSGATVGVHKVTIIGTVMPAGAHVVVNGQPAKVSGSSFTGTLYVSTPNQKIVVSAVAHGYLASQTSATVSYSANVAHQLVASAAAAATPAPSSTAPKVTTSVLTQAFGLSVASVDKSSQTTNAKSTNTSTTPPSSASGSGSPAPSNGSSSPSSSGSGSTGPSSPPSSSPSTPAPAPAPTPAEIAAAIHTAWVHGCVKVEAGGSVVPYCTCTYNHLAGQLQTRTSTEQMLKQMVGYLRSGDFRTVPAVIRRAVDACASKLPPLDPMTGKPVLSTFPGAAPTAAPASNQGSQSNPPATPVPPAPVPPAPVPPAPVPPAPVPPAPVAPVAPATVTPVPNIRSAFQQFNSTPTRNMPTSVTPADAGSVAEADRGAAAAGLTPQSGQQRVRDARIVAKALSYALVWVANHDRPGPYPYWYRVQRRLRHRLAAALKLAA